MDSIKTSLVNSPKGSSMQNNDLMGYHPSVFRILLDSSISVVPSCDSGKAVSKMSNLFSETVRSISGQTNFVVHDQS